MNSLINILFFNKFIIIKSVILFHFIFILHNCVIRLPAITFTQSGTAAEKQMIGEEKSIEKDGWILSSIRTSALGSEVWKRENLNSDVSIDHSDEEFLLHIKRLAYLQGDIKQFKQKSFVAESLSGKIVINPVLNQTKYKMEYDDIKNRIEEVLKLTNESREILYKKKEKIFEQEEKNPSRLKILKNKYLLLYYNLTEDGEYYEESKNKWIKKGI